MAAGRIYQLFGFVCGLALIVYGFNLEAIGMPGARQFTSQFLGANLLVGGSAALFLSLYYLFKPTMPAKVAQPSGPTPDVGVGLVVEEEPPSQYGFYKHIEYVGYFFTALGLFSVADLILQVLIPPLYNQARWWVEILLATFGVLSYAIFGSIGRVGAQEEKLYVPSSQPQMSTSSTVPSSPAPGPQSSAEPFSETLQLQIEQFSKLGAGVYERKLGGSTYDMFRVEHEVVTVWRERRQEIGSAYLAGPYELTRKLMEEYVNRGEELKIGYLSVSVDALHGLMSLQEQALQPVPTAQS